MFEIEIKALLSEEKYNQLKEQLPKQFEQINHETLHTTRYNPGDVRLRYSDTTAEVVIKTGEPTTVSRQETIVPVASKEELQRIARIFELLLFAADPPWTNEKHEFICKRNGYTYVLSLQNIERFARILEVEHMSETEDATHEETIKQIITELGCEPIDPADFKERIAEYIKNNREH
jgi:adenylate cyclase class IV